MEVNNAKKLNERNKINLFGNNDDEIINVNIIKIRTQSNVALFKL